ncbi:hypothetical protein [Jannaschia pohangensis]|uniref:DnaA N-terminal domain-containing protein n=1 Tax=Jannaschia pohangensis TaxID=390807 RepID=A0A1I3USG4_9RHOB|nr:hypothetical protein [Jannaschia pohangensis]SFJ85875.1 hypothetical protein SAMN04488095_3847 [Jannaschia pohangensis]
MIRRDARPVTGVHAPAFKYDLLTALGTYACTGDKHRTRLVIRFITLVTARYDWRADTLTTGQREIARMWSVDERTVKREMARLREMGWLVMKRPAARGRVACYGLGLQTLLADTRDVWALVGPDFEARMAGPDLIATSDKVIAFPRVVSEGASPWDDLCARWHGVDPATHLAWIAPLSFDGFDDGVLSLRAPTGFHASFVRTHHLGDLMAHGRRVMPGLTEVRISPR